MTKKLSEAKSVSEFVNQPEESKKKRNRKDRSNQLEFFVRQNTPDEKFIIAKWNGEVIEMFRVSNKLDIRTITKEQDDWLYEALHAMASRQRGGAKPNMSVTLPGKFELGKSIKGLVIGLMLTSYPEFSDALIDFTPIDNPLVTTTN